MAPRICPPGRGPRWVSWFAKLTPPPDVFAVVMATGIVSVAAADHTYWRIALVLRMLAAAAFALLSVGAIILVLSHPRRVSKLVRDPDIALRMFTFATACAMLTACWPSHPAIAWWLGGVGLLGWVALVPLAGMDVQSRRPRQLRDHAHGAWLLPSVATQALASTAADIALHSHRATLVVIAAGAWSVGLVIYLAVSALIGWRAFTAPLKPTIVTPDSWILMGALASAALAGDHIFLAARAVPAFSELAACAHVATWCTWVGASVWIPVLLYAEVWRADHLTGSLHYQGVWWSAVFPIGMYASASETTATALGVRSLGTISLVFFWIALTVWTLIALGLLHSSLARTTRPPRPWRPGAGTAA